ncbi:ATP-binding cassette domain-containing protein [Devosia aurantiaca]|uniref:ATP-binding cassette domain-containing protein n=1 Tax=Devosia aurantiaca TaxID=2714858 RepID=A0A6M1SG92_9HYPH|nr:ATP-binding cassette domain-containing protein [Devosia aurantiaca]NGP18507.1 ATP-binding cassette domain-containing protein [Devosia aurantiaca]
MLRASDLEFRYRPEDEPYHFSFEATAGQVTAISGASGSGKSTLLDLLAGFLQPSQGALTLDDTNLLPLQPEHRPVSLLLQSDNLFEHLSAVGNVELGMPRGERGREKVDAALVEVGLSGLGGRPASTLSGGQKQRVALARTLLRNRPVLLLDEPFSALDDETRGTVRTLVGELSRRHGWHTVLVSHHADDIAALASRHYRIVDKRLSDAA